MTTLTVDLEQFPEFKSWKDGETYDLTLAGTQVRKEGNMATLEVEDLSAEDSDEVPVKEATEESGHSYEDRMSKRKMPKAIMIVSGGR